MRDVVFLLIAVGFFGLVAAYVRGCVSLVGDAPAAAGGADAATEAGEVAA